MEVLNQGIIKLEGSKNWNVWKFQMIVLLRGQEVYEVVTGQSVKPEDATGRAAWEKKDAKAQTLLVTRMSEDVMLHIISCTNSAEMWRKLQSVFEQKTETSIHIVQQRFFQYKYEEGMEMAVFLSKVQAMQNQLKQMGEGISDKFVITKVLMSLPDDYKHFVSAWESAPDDKQTYDNLVARLLVEEERLKEKGETSQQTTALVAKNMNKKNIKCYKCNKFGHYQSECKSKDNTESQNNKSNNRCFYCKKVGHFKNQCRFRKNKESGSNNESKSNAFVVSNSFSEHFQQSKWLVDTGASEHMCCDRALFSSYASVSRKSVVVGNGAAIGVLGCGQIAAQVYNGHEWVDTTIDNVLHVPELRTNLLSVKSVVGKGYVMITDDSSCKFYKKSKVCAIAKKSGDLYYLNLRYKCDVVNTAKVEADLNEWHEKFAHQNLDYVKTVLKKNNIEVKNLNMGKCESCLEGKIHRLPFSNSDSKTTKTCELIHADTCGPMEELSVGGSKYCVVFKDDYSNYRSVYFVKGKHEVKKCVEDFVSKAENETGNKVKIFRSDNGLEFVNKEVKELFLRRGIVHQNTVPYTPEQNGKAERENRTLIEAARTMLCAKKLPKKLWAEAINTAAYVLNRTGKSNETGRTPYEIWTNKSFDIHSLKIFGTPVFIHIPKEKRRKWDPKGERGILVGYGENSKGFRIFLPHKNSVEVKRDVFFVSKPHDFVEQKSVETSEPLVICDAETPSSSQIEPVHAIEENNISESQSPPEVLVQQLETEESSDEYEVCGSDEPSDDNEDIHHSTPDNDLNRRSKRVRKQTSFYKCHNVHTDDDNPKTYEEAMRRPDASKWADAINKELQTLKENNTWKYCDIPVNKKVISSKWVFKIKRSDSNIHYKARLVARGFEQRDELDLNEIYAPVAKLSTFRVFVAVATNLKLPIYQMDVTGAFLYGEIKEDVYISLPDGAYCGSKNIVKLNKSLYGLKKSPKYWNDKFNSVITKAGFIKSKSDSCLYTKISDRDQIYILLYVDDLLICGTNEKQIYELKSVLNKEFRMKDLGLVSDFLGINVKQNLESGVTELSQKNYLENVLSRFKMTNCKPISTPMDQNFNAKIFLNDNNEFEVNRNTENLCRQIIGCLMYAVSGTRPDLCVAVSILSRYQNNANNTLLNALKRVLRYVKYTIDYKLVFKCNNEKLIGYCDADWGGDLRDRKSTTGFCFMFSNCLISWCSKKQCSVSLSSTESEYVAVSMAASEASWLINLLNDFNIQNLYPTTIFCDNQSAITVSSTDSVKRLKHIDIRYHFVKELVKKGKICLKYIKTEEQIADMFTKALNKELLSKFTEKCGIII